MTEQAAPPSATTSPSESNSQDQEGPPKAQPLPKVFFNRTVAGERVDATFKVIDRHGVDVTDLFDLKTIGLEMDLLPWGHGRLRFLEKGWTIDCGPDKVVNHMKITHESGYDLMDGIEPNMVQHHYPRDGRVQIEIIFDAEWGG